MSDGVDLEKQGKCYQLILINSIENDPCAAGHGVGIFISNGLSPARRANLLADGQRFPFPAQEENSELKWVQLAQKSIAQQY